MCLPPYHHRSPVGVVEALLVEQGAHEAVGQRGVHAEAAQVRRLQQLWFTTIGERKEEGGARVCVCALLCVHVCVWLCVSRTVGRTDGRTDLGGQLKELRVDALPQKRVEGGGRGEAVEAGVRPVCHAWGVVVGRVSLPPL